MFYFKEKKLFSVKKMLSIWVFDDFIVFLHNKYRINKSNKNKKWEYFQNYSVIKLRRSRLVEWKIS